MRSRHISQLQNYIKIEKGTSREELLTSPDPFNLLTSIFFVLRVSPKYFLAHNTEHFIEFLLYVGYRRRYRLCRVISMTQN